MIFLAAVIACLFSEGPPPVTTCTFVLPDSSVEIKVVYLHEDENGDRYIVTGERVVPGAEIVVAAQGRPAQVSVKTEDGLTLVNELMPVFIDDFETGGLGQWTTHS